MGTKLVELFANMVVERRNMIISKGGACIESVRGVYSGGVFECVSFLCF
jgi:hypothetical protein